MNHLRVFQLKISYSWHSFTHKMKFKTICSLFYTNYFPKKYFFVLGLCLNGEDASNENIYSEQIKPLWTHISLKIQSPYIAMNCQKTNFSSSCSLTSIPKWRDDEA